MNTCMSQPAMFVPHNGPPPPILLPCHYYMEQSSAPQMLEVFLGSALMGLVIFLAPILYIVHYRELRRVEGGPAYSALSTVAN